MPEPADVSKPPPSVAEAVKREITERGLTVTKVIHQADCGNTYLFDIVAGRKPISPMAAVKLARVLGVDYRHFLRIQADHDAYQALQKLNTCRPG